MEHQKTIYLIRAERAGESALTKRDKSTFNVFDEKEEAEIACSYFQNMTKDVNFKVVEYVQRD